VLDIRLRRLTIVAVGGTRVVDFSDKLNIIVGPYGSGKSSLLELIKYSMGGSAILSEAVSTGVTSVQLEVLLAGRKLTFERHIGDLKISVTSGGELVAALHSTSARAKGTQLASTFLATAVGLPVFQVRQSGNGSKVETISFWDVFRFIYVSQDDMGHSIAGHADKILNSKRRHALELMFGLIDQEVAELQVSEGRAKELLRAQQTRLRDVSAFLAASEIPTRAQASERIEELRRSASEARAEIASVRRIERAASPELNDNRAHIGELQRRASSLRQAVVELEAEVASRAQLDAQLAVDTDRARRQADVAELFSTVDFHLCPRCLQAVMPDRSEVDQCYLCLQSVEARESSNPTGEADRLEDVRHEVRALLREDQAALEILRGEAQLAEIRLASTEADLRLKAEQYVTPRFEDVARLSELAARAGAEEERLSSVIAQWQVHAGIVADLADAERQLSDVAAALASATAEVETRRAYVAEFSETFDEIVRELELAWYAKARIDLKTFLPVIGSAEYATLSGGQRTVVSVAYHLALLTVGLVHPAIHIPTLLILDTPSKYLGAKDRE
jgi:hypothetical protein